MFNNSNSKTPPDFLGCVIFEGNDLIDLVDNKSTIDNTFTQTHTLT